MRTALVKRVPRLPRRAADAHKGDAGRVLVIGGSRGMIGAPALAGLAALRSGCGLVRLAVPDEIQPAVAVLAPCATTLPLESTNAGRIAASAARMSLHDAVKDEADVVALGPGMDRSPDGVRLVRWVLSVAARPVVVDADGLNNLCGAEERLRVRRPAPLTLTPHPGEMHRLLKAVGLQVDPFKECRKAAERFAEFCKAVVVLKGKGTVVTDGRRTYINKTGNAGMATGGTGDVLTGVIAGLIAQGMEAFDAAVLGVYLHGRAGDRAARQKGRLSMIATDLLDALPAALLSHERRGRR
jgi:ADP-dependent NAD(P)H-hydrate dehydratase